MKRFLTALAMTVLTFTMFSFALPVLAADESAKKTSCESIGGTYADGQCATGDGEATVNTLIATAVNIFSWAVGLIAVIFVIYAGFRYVTSGGDAGKVTSAKNTLVYAIIGLVIAATAQIIVQFVLKSATTPIKKETSILISEHTS